MTAHSADRHSRRATTLRAAEGLDEAAKTELAAVVDEESARLDALIGEAFEMAEIDANTWRFTSPATSEALLDQAVEESRKRWLDAGL